MKSVAIIRLGVGNTAAIAFALERLCARGVVTDDPAVVAQAERLILPGVGAAAFGAARLAETGLGEAVKAFTRPLLGVCLGMQLLHERSEEGDASGLGLLDGHVRRLKSFEGRPVPHMGWSRIRPSKECLLMEGVGYGEFFYFAHSYACPLSEATVAVADYGEPFAAAAQRGNFFGCQFHPERSGAAGARVLENFLAAPC